MGEPHTSERPNLFHLAPSELSQDAVLAWLLSWADPALAAERPALQAVGARLLRDLLAAAGAASPSEASPVRVRKQFDHIDILVEVGHECVLAIEDKVHTGEHGKQLQEYREAVAKRYGARPAAFVYLRTGEQPNLGGVASAGWTPVGRGLVLNTLRPARGISEVVDEFVDHLERMEADVRAFERLLPSGWKELHPVPRRRLVWAGLFQQLAPDLGGRWDYVSNPTGGFMGFWWSFLPVPGGSVYLQLEHDRLVTKVDSGANGDRRKLRDTWMVRVVSIQGPVRFRRPDRLGHGRWMTVGVATDCYLRTTEGGGLDLPATRAVLEMATASLKTLVTSHTSSIEQHLE